MTSPFQWSETRSKAAVALAQGKTQKEVAEMVGVTDRSIRFWLNNHEFSEEVDRLSVMVGIASRAVRLRLASRAISQFIKEEAGIIETKKDILEWLKFAQSETDGAKLDLTALLEGYQADDSNG